MVKVNERQLANHTSNLTQWAERAIQIAGTQVIVRIRENKLHILCEGRECPDKQTAVAQLVQALSATNVNDLLVAENLSPVDQVFIYGRQYGEKRPDWTEMLALVRDEHSRDYPGQAKYAKAGLSSMKEEMQEISLNPSYKAESPVFADSLQNLARQGNTDAIARILGENLKSLGVRVKVTAKVLRKKDAENSGIKERRLWVFCESAYSPEPSLLAAPIAQKLRELGVEGFRDAVIISQVSGEENPDWMLRVDLTPLEEILKQWASWGDIESIARLIDQRIDPNIEISAVLKEATLHISCTQKNPDVTSEQPHPRSAPEKHLGMSAIAPILNSIAPRGIQAAIVYGHSAEEAPPVWVEWVDLPAARRPELAISTLDLAQDGHEAALEFLLGRLLNPDLDWRIATGGIRVQVRRKEDILHVMTDAPVCPSQRSVADPIAKFVRQLEIPGVSGLRVYGRRAGQKQPLWSYGLDLVPGHRQAQETTPDFAASDEYGPVATDDLPLENNVEERLTDVTITAEVSDVSEAFINSGKTTQRFWHDCQQMMQKLKLAMVRSQLFAPNERRQDLLSLPGQATYQGVKVALVWGTAGIMLTWSLDLVLGQIIKASKTQIQESLVLSEKALVKEVEESASKPTQNTGGDLHLPDVSLRQQQNKNPKVFNSSGFTKPGDTEVNLNANSQKANRPRRPSSFPSLNNPQLEEKMALYHQRVAEQGPPDILIVGSSRALRGVDPEVLQKALAAQGYGDADIFNFGVNGATAQLVELLLRRCLTAEQLPKMIIWADGARAFNSGRMDATYNSIASSSGYKQLVAGTLPKGNSNSDRTGKNLEPFTATPIVPGAPISSENIDEWLNQSAANFSAAYQERDRLQAIFRDGFANTFKFSNSAPETEEESAIQQKFAGWDGFLPLNIRFIPKSYYQKHSKVTGEFDNDYKNFQLAGSQITALESIVQFTQANQITLVFVNLPLTKEYLDPVRNRYEQEFEMYMLSLSMSRGFIFRNWSQLWPTRNDYFSDPSHLNRYGAAAVSERLGQDPLLPWPKKK